MTVFDFIIILVLISVMGKVAIALGGPLVDHLGELARASAAGRRERAGSPDADLLDESAMEELERRLARIEERLDFVEELRSPRERPSLPGGGRP